MSIAVPEAERCYPQVRSLSATIIRIDTISTSPLLKRVYFDVRSSASGFHRQQHGDLRVTVWMRVDDYAKDIIDWVKSRDIVSPPTLFTCIDLAHDTCVFTNVVASSQQVKFWAVACEGQDDDYCTCDCQSDTLYVDAQGGVGTTGTTTPLPVELGPNECQAQVADPINATNCNLYLGRQDLSLPTDLGPPLAFARHYNSHTLDATSSLGPNWRHSFEYSLSKNTTSGDYTLLEGSGRQVCFVRNDLISGTTHTVSYLPPYGVPYRFQEDTTTGRLVVSMPDDTKLIFYGTGDVDSLEDLSGNGVCFFRTDGRLDSLANSSGRSLRFSYQSNRLQNVANGAGANLATFSYDSTGQHLRRVTYGDNSWEQYAYGQNGYDANSIVRVETSDGTTRAYSYDSSGLASGYELGGQYEQVQVSWVREEAICGIQKDTIRTFVEVPVASSEYVSIWSPDRTMRQLSRREDADCATCGVKYEYDGNGMKRAVTYANGTTDSAFYDSRGNRIEYVRGANTSLRQQTKSQFATAHNRPLWDQLVSVGNPGDTNRWTYTRDTYGNPTRIVESGWNDASTRFNDTSWFTFNGASQLTKADGPRRDVPDTVQYVYYANGDLRYAILANADTTTFGERNTLGHRTWIRSSPGDTTRFTFDARGRLLRITSLAGTAESSAVAYTFDVEDRVGSISTSLGDTTILHRNAAGYVDTVTAWNHDYSAYAFDASGNPISENVFTSTGILRKAESYTYDAQHQVTRIVGPYADTTSLTYAPGGTLDTVIDPRGFRTVYQHDSLRRLSAILQVRGPDTLTTRYSYDIHDNVTKVIDPDGYEYAFRYDDKNLCVFDSCGATGVTRHGFDAAGNEIWTINASGDSIAFSYDALDRLTEAAYPDTQSVAYAYDGTEYANGTSRLYRETTPACSTKYRYDMLGRLHQEFRWIGSDTTRYTTTYTYDKDDHLRDVTYPSGVRIVYDRNFGGDIIAVRAYMYSRWVTLVDNVTYVPFGGPEQWTLGNGITVTNRYDQRYQIDSIGTSPTNVMKWRYSYDPSGNVAHLRDCLDSTGNRYFTYDGSNRLLTARSRSWPDTLLRFVYSPNGNLDTLIEVDSAGASTSAFQYSRNRLQGISGSDTVAYSYDSVGNVLAEIDGGVSWNYNYNKRGELTSLSDGALTTSFQYDGSHRRIKKTCGNAATIYIYDQFDQLISEYDQDGKWLWDYVYWNGQLLAKLKKGLSPGIEPDPDPTPDNLNSGEESLSLGLDEEAGTDGSTPPPDEPILLPYYYHLDHLGTPWYLTDRNKNIVWRGEYYPYGELYHEQDNTPNPHRLPGQLADQTTDLYYNWHRYYAPRLGRYAQSDPIGIAGGINQYAYSSGNPLLYVDPDGQTPVVLLLYLGFEIGASLWDAYNTYQALQDDCVSKEDKLLMVAGFTAGLYGPGGGYGTAARALKGQLHHAISKKVLDALGNHPILAGVYKYRDGRLVTRALNRESHLGYQKWHRELDEEVARWIDDHPYARRGNFERYLRMRYVKSDLLRRFPHGL